MHMELFPFSTIAKVIECHVNAVDIPLQSASFHYLHFMRDIFLLLMYKKLSTSQEMFLEFLEGNCDLSWIFIIYIGLSQ